jgi:uncharacterized protein with PQ loop repeat
MDAVEIAATSFAVCNSLRVVAYIPQIVSLARQQDGARAISCLAWTSFTASHVTAVVYAVIVVSDARMAALFAANAACCST